MSGSRDVAEDVADQLAELGEVSVHGYFGGWALRCRGVQFAMVMDSVYFRVDDSTRPAYLDAGATPFTYVAAGREVVVQRYYSLPDGVIDDRARLQTLALEAIARTR